MFSLASTFSGLTALLATIPSSLAQVPAPLQCSGECGNAHDPTLIRRASDGTYFRFATGHGIPIHTAPALTGPWEFTGSILDETIDAWAPDVSFVEDSGVYNLYYSISEFGTQNSYQGVATSANLEAGSWTDHGSTGVESQEGDAYNAIDGNLINVGDTNYFTFGSFWGNTFQTTLSADGLSKASGEPYNIQFNSTGDQPAEAPYIFRNGDFFYLFFSNGKCCDYPNTNPAPGEEYSIMVCRGDAVEGPYIDAQGTPCTDNGGTTVLASNGIMYGPGGQGVYNDPEYGPVLYYHFVDTEKGYADGDKVFGIHPLDFGGGWPTVS